MAEARILIANRGEIAVRIIRTCREMAIPTVAVYSDADRDALFVEMADHAYHLGPPAPSESYLNIPKILEIARQARATMVHPGYGFLAENPDFARAATDAGLAFIGPGWRAMALLGDKVAARQAAIRAGAPVVPGTQDPVTSDVARGEAEQIGYPLVVKAAFGGGGKGMRLVESAGELDAALERSAREAHSYFGRPEIYLERYIERAHHVEAQIMADSHGHFSFLGERDCSTQRRYQKLIEEAPSPVVDPVLRARIGEAAVGIAREAGYVNAGTVEFLVEPDGSFYFMEVNARLQVEHPVTEMVSGLDLVRYQILVALGEAVELAPVMRGHSIECRLNAEDPYRDFLPGPGMVTRHRRPGGPFVRLDSGLTEGRPVAGAYDSLFAKLIVWAEDRELARRRMLQALDDVQIEGIPTTIPFHKWALQTEEFRKGEMTTKFVEQALAAGALQPPEGGDPFVRTPADPPRRALQLVVEVDGHRVPVSIVDDGLRTPPPPAAAHSHGSLVGGTGEVIEAQMQGRILDVLVEEGQDISAGDTVVILEAMKMENHVTATIDGQVTKLAVSKGEVVEIGQAIAVIEEPSGR
jgi:acetyl-CoA/propionyl-CoA carboxylase biotin carboxyl carrier protein